MKNTYLDIVKQSYNFPQEGFDLEKEYLTFNGISLKHLIDKYGTPFNLIYLPKISNQIKKAKSLFNKLIVKNNYSGNYNYCYCTKCNHFYHVINEALKENVNLETSSTFDIDLILNLYNAGKINNQTTIIHNGYKTVDYINKIILLNKKGFTNSITIIDGAKELSRIEKQAKGVKIKVGLRMAIIEEVQSAYTTSRLGIPYGEMIDFFNKKIKNNKYVELKMFHFFIDSGIKDTLYYWREFNKAITLYSLLKSDCKTLDSLNLGGGFPIPKNLSFEYDYEYMINEIIRNIKEVCTSNNIPTPNIYTEFGRYTVGESSAIIFEVLEQKQQNDTELWYIINNSLMNTIPDAWSIAEKFILLPINKWRNKYTRVNIGGISCDHSDYYNSEDFNQELILPVYSDDDKEPLYVGFFHTGAYQDAISGYGGIKHCLIPAPRHVIIDKDENGNIIDYLYREEQTVNQMFSILGYKL